MQPEIAIIESDEPAQRSLRQRAKQGAEDRAMQAYQDELEERDIQKAILQSKRAIREAASPEENPRRLSNRSKLVKWCSGATDGDHIIHELEPDVDWVAGFRLDTYVCVEAKIPELTAYAKELYNIPEIVAPAPSPVPAQAAKKKAKKRKALDLAWGNRVHTSAVAQRKFGMADDEVPGPSPSKSRNRSPPMRSPSTKPCSPLEKEPALGTAEHEGKTFEDLLVACRDLVQSPQHVSPEPEPERRGVDMYAIPRKRAPRLTFSTGDLTNPNDDDLKSTPFTRDNPLGPAPLEQNLTNFLTTQGRIEAPNSTEQALSPTTVIAAVPAVPSNNWSMLPSHPGPGPSAVTLSRPVSKRPSRSVTMDLPSSHRRLLPYTTHRIQPPTHQPGRIPIHHQGAGLTKNNPRGEISARSAKGLGVDYKYKYHLAQGLHMHEGPWPHKLEFDHPKTLPSNNPLFNPRFPTQALIARAIRNTGCWLQPADPIVSSLEAMCANYLSSSNHA